MIRALNLAPSAESCSSLIWCALERTKGTLSCCWCAEAWAPFPGCIFGRKPSQTHNYWSWWHRLEPLWSAWAESLVKTQQKGGVSVWRWAAGPPTIPTIPTCKQGADAVLRQNPAHHTYGGAGNLDRYWEQKANTVFSGNVMTTCAVHHSHRCKNCQTSLKKQFLETIINPKESLITFLCIPLSQFHLPSCFDNIEW